MGPFHQRAIELHRCFVVASDHGWMLPGTKYAAALPRCFASAIDKHFVLLSGQLCTPHMAKQGNTSC